ncbi:MAG: DUF6089 family protein [Janthinobacterium lividum]
MTKLSTYSSLLAGLALVGTIQQADAQQFTKRKQYTSIGVNLNAMNYFGDVNPQTNFASFKAGDTRPNLGISITHRYFPRISGRFGLAAGRVAANDDNQGGSGDAYYRNNRNVNFRTNIYEASAVMIVDLIENRNNYLKRPDFVPYLFGGIAGFYFNPQGTRNGGQTWTDLQPLKTEGVDYSRVSFAIPFGGGVRYRINRNMDASFEIGFRKTFTGYLDDVKGTYIGQAALAQGDNAAGDRQYFGYGITKDHRNGTFDAAGVKRGQDKTDWYTVVGFSLNYILNPRIKNPKFR